MIRFLLTAAALVGLLAPTGASAKGPIEASLAGPGLDAPVLVALAYEGPADDPRRAPLEHLALATGRMTAVLTGASLESFEAATRRLRVARPTGDLGPRFTLTYRFEGPGGGDEIVQDVYPYAEPRPVTYLAPDQLLHTQGSWFVADEGLEHALVEAGLPPASSGGGGGFVWAALALLAAGAAAARLGTRRAGAVYHRR